MPISDGTTCRRGWHQSSAGLRYKHYYIHDFLKFKSHFNPCAFLNFLHTFTLAGSICVFCLFAYEATEKALLSLIYALHYTYIQYIQCTSIDHSNSSISISNMQHFISQREEFETARDGILVWLTEMDLQLTNIEHFSECDIQAKIKQLRVSLSQYFRPTQSRPTWWSEKYLRGILTDFFTLY